MSKNNALQIAIVVSNAMSRVMRGYTHQEQNSTMLKVQARIGKMMRSRMKTNKKEMLQALGVEHKIWHETTSSFSSSTPIFAVDTVMKLYSKFPREMERFADLNEKLMEKFAIIHNEYEDGCEHLEDNDNALVDKFIELFEPYSGVGLGRSALHGLKNNTLNNLALEGKKIAKGF